MGKYLIRHATGDEEGTVIDARTIERWIENVNLIKHAADELLPGTTYVAARLAELIEVEGPL